MRVTQLYNIMKRSYNIFIVGTTSVGKTKLSLELAQSLKTEIISCDSMQLYRHADIMTAKATKQEQGRAKHHMIDLIHLDQQGFNRNKYYQYSKTIFDRLHDEGKSPVIVGGTNYYIESLLFDNEMGADQSESEETEVPAARKEEILAIKEKSSKMTGPERYELFTQIDPILAAKIHKNDEQRISNYLNKYFTTFKKPSLSYQLPTYKLRNQNTIVFWIKNEDREQLRTMITKRINEMLDINGLTEIVSVHLFLQNSKENLGGVLQSIGYKEFSSYVKQLKIEVPPDVAESYEKLYQYVNKYLVSCELGSHSQVLEKCKEQLIVSTCQYAKRQITWIKNRLFGSKEITNNFFILDITGQGDILHRFDTQVKQKAIEIIQKIDKQGFGSIQGGLAPQDIQKIQHYGQVKMIGEWKKFTCTLCNKQMNGKLEYDQHNRSGQHKKMVKHKNREMNKRQEIETLKFKKYE